MTSAREKADKEHDDAVSQLLRELTGGENSAAFDDTSRGAVGDDTHQSVARAAVVPFDDPEDREDAAAEASDTPLLDSSEDEAAAEASVTRALKGREVLETVEAGAREEARHGVTELVRSIDPELVFGVALGMEEPEDIAERLGYSLSEYREIEKLKAFQIAVKKSRAELDKNGDMFRGKAHIIAEKVMDTAYAKALDPTTPLKETTEFLKVVSGLADLVPKANVQATGSGFQVNIVLPEMTREALTAGEVVKKDALSGIAGGEAVKDAEVVFDIPADVPKKGKEGKHDDKGV